jgi:hypothetical protein
VAVAVAVPVVAVALLVPAMGMNPVVDEVVAALAQSREAAVPVVVWAVLAVLAAL